MRVSVTERLAVTESVAVGVAKSVANSVAMSYGCASCNGCGSWSRNDCGNGYVWQCEYVYLVQRTKRVVQGGTRFSTLRHVDLGHHHFKLQHKLDHTVDTLKLTSLETADAGGEVAM